MGPVLREFAYAIRTAVNETTGKTPAELFLGRKLITPFQKFVMVSDGTEFAVGDIEKLFEEARRNTETKQENERNIIIDVGVMCKLSGTGLDPVTKQATVRYLYHSATAATHMSRSMVGRRGQGPRKKYRGDEEVIPSTSNYNLRPRSGKRVESRPTMGMKTQQGGPVRVRKSKGRNYNPYIEKQTRPGTKNTR
ncbi:uncharacterized protein TNCV_1357971 [Trichonephila clavipes]|uniref:Uncharacterized protein n=1 Tax=Trichonephila clavipes TaxID=2585209 RepID=A0A8X6SH82_TRICX|nr:uncharacterized protein TNCV_1357971 [Trichonephila clavipes]